jgi:hypothetical protein
LNSLLFGVSDDGEMPCAAKPRVRFNSTEFAKQDGVPLRFSDAGVFPRFVPRSVRRPEMLLDAG